MFNTNFDTDFIQIANVDVMVKNQGEAKAALIFGNTSLPHVNFKNFPVFSHLTISSSTTSSFSMVS
jgi:hypothetical protein